MSNNPRAVKYRRLALVEPDEGKAQLLRLLAEEAEKGILVTSDLHRAVTQQALPMKISPE
jgi:hypothetical protein